MDATSSEHSVLEQPETKLVSKVLPIKLSLPISLCIHADSACDSRCCWGGHLSAQVSLDGGAGSGRVQSVERGPKIKGRSGIKGQRHISHDW